MLSQSSPLSMLRLAMFLILARLSFALVKISRRITFVYVPVLEPNLHRSLRHADVLGNTLTDESGGSGVLVEFDFESDELVLGRTLTLLVLLLLCERALARRPPGRRSCGSTR
jgi:hypothetical protein